MGICKQNNAGKIRVYQTELKIPGNIENSNWLISHKAQGLRYMPIPLEFGNKVFGEQQWLTGAI